MSGVDVDVEHSVDYHLSPSELIAKLHNICENNDFHRPVLLDSVLIRENMGQ